ncbi:Molybdate-binding protein ModA [Vibrio stylophorae]|uniref:Molybdate-binding protein ModA n=1 Tax=Vibrio stylophorae TaxID=659351 RepID=A0ABM8ZY83_9VIBR|nr:molybdate ABC transporter substrate-binding protein [Vibrio stylophorae]CAH0535216.1 Molybdate-binding protein ModA [Vibrio stylophorae]
MLLRRYFVLLLSGLMFFSSSLWAAVNQEKIVVFAASSMTYPLNRLAKIYNAEHGTNVVVSLGSSSTMARQIERGAPADIFISANQMWMDHLLKAKSFKDAKPVVVAQNELVLITQMDRVMKPFLINDQTALAKVIGQGRLVMGDPSHVPQGQYAKTLLESLGLWQQVQSKIVPAANARNALMMVERGQAAFGVAYFSDAASSDKVKVIGRFPPAKQPQIDYQMIALNQRPDVLAFYQFLLSDKAKPVWMRFGFKMED